MGRLVKMFLVFSVVLAALVFSFEGAHKSMAADKQTSVAKQIPLKGPYQKDKGYCWFVVVQQYAGSADNNKEPKRSKLVVYENGKPLSPAHSQHDDIISKGNGRYLHWGDDIYFSASDNSDPNKNGKKYTISVE